VVTHFTTGYHRDQVTGEWRYRAADPYAAWVFALSNADLLERAEDRVRLRQQVQAQAQGVEPLTPAAAPGLAPDARALVALLRNDDPQRVPALIRGLSPRIRAELNAINPAAHDLSEMQAQVILVHGRHDNLIPYTESVALAEALPPERVQLFLIEGVAHVDVRLHREDVPKLVRAMALLLAQRAAP
jgi:pimeloyl-ACP methyl ester carboxylesterase